MQGSVPSVGLTKLQAALAAAISFNDASAHTIATLAFTLSQQTVVQVNLFALFRIGTAGQTIVFTMDDNGNGSDLIPGALVTGSGNPHVVAADIAQQSFNFVFFLTLAAGNHSLRFQVGNQSGLNAIQIFAGEIDVIY